MRRCANIARMSGVCVFLLRRSTPPHKPVSIPMRQTAGAWLFPLPRIYHREPSVAVGTFAGSAGGGGKQKQKLRTALRGNHGPLGLTLREGYSTGDRDLLFWPSCFFHGRSWRCVLHCLYTLQWQHKNAD